ncbi:MAG: tRNA (adenosine(37)-N6)-threonylcarbamoyltransferase complex ATPase subunit type 1 TsaE [Planctomycetes bacterium RIFCSPHIGHO2_12_42_15]|nr:MAG: tRNA (adenosine(37)-N6)-threonylcarbamoyltransferase complex ATPase subunit type 1 TsaE [Planctomycetes bacterium RIFCSPHIGHO2_12_42_15]
MKEKKLTFKSVSAGETIKFGERLGRLLAPGHVIALLGELGAGKTTMVKGIVQGLGVTDRRTVKSPTFALVHRYEGRIPVYHFDAYRLENAQEMLDIGSDEMIYGKGVSIIEWADRVPGCLPEEYLMITLTSISKNERCIEVQSCGKCYDDVIKTLVKVNTECF